MIPLETRLAQRERPLDKPVMHHRWRNLAFLHWAMDPGFIQTLLPPGLSVDTFDGRAYVGLVPFTMHGIRLSWLPALPGVRSSHETNVRTYVYDDRGVPGVWFFSLDAANPVFVHTARIWYHLNYVRSNMSVASTEAGTTYGSVRRWPRDDSAECRVEIACVGEPRPTEPGSLEFFLIERYVLYAYGNGILFDGRVWHDPYRIAEAECLSLQETMLKAAHIERPSSEPHTMFSPGVDVDVYPIRRVTGSSVR